MGSSTPPLEAATPISTAESTTPPPMAVQNHHCSTSGLRVGVGDERGFGGRRGRLRDRRAERERRVLARLDLQGAPRELRVAARGDREMRTGRERQLEPHVGEAEAVDRDRGLGHPHQLDPREACPLLQLGAQGRHVRAEVGGGVRVGEHGLDLCVRFRILALLEEHGREVVANRRRIPERERRAERGLRLGEAAGLDVRDALREECACLR